MANNRIISVDPGCLSSTGHHRAVNEFVQAYAAKQGLAVRILVNQQCVTPTVEELAAEPVLTSHVYVLPPEDDPRTTIVNINHYNEAMFRDLMQHVTPISPGDVVFFHTINHWQLLGIYWWASSVDLSGAKVRMILMFPPFFQVGSNSRTLVNDFYKNVFAIWRDFDGDVLFFAETDAIRGFYEELGCHEIQQIPIPIDFEGVPEEYTAKPRVGDATTFVFPGEARGEKGTDLLPDAVRLLRKTGKRVRIVMQMIDGAPPHVAQDMRNLAPDIEVFGQTLHRLEYFEFLKKGDAILIPYRPTTYQHRGSGIFIEALGVGRPIITTRATWMHGELEKLDAVCGLAAEYNSESLAEVMCQFLQEKTQIRENAIALAPTIRSTHNAGKVMKRILD